MQAVLCLLDGIYVRYYISGVVCGFRLRRCAVSVGRSRLPRPSFSRRSIIGASSLDESITHCERRATQHPPRLHRTFMWSGHNLMRISYYVIINRRIYFVLRDCCFAPAGPRAPSLFIRLFLLRIVWFFFSFSAQTSSYIHVPNSRDRTCSIG